MGAARIGVILPVFNEVKQLPRVLEEVGRFLDRHGEYHFVFVDDGSQDRTPQEIASWIDRHGQGRAQLLALPANVGKGQAIRQGLSLLVEQEVICFTDGDLAYPLDHLPRLVEALSLGDMVIGSRALVHSDQKNITLPRIVMGWTFNKLARVVLGMPYRDTQAGLKGFRAAAARRIFACQRLADFSFDVELIFVARRLGLTVVEIPAVVDENHSYKISTVRWWRDPLRMFLALWRIRLNALRGRYDAASGA